MSRGREADDEQRLRLLEGLAASIREKGLAETQLSDIVRHARASRRTFYKHFPDKDACFVELARQAAEVVRDGVATAIDREAPWTAQIDQAIDAYLAHLAAEPEMAATFASPALGQSVVRAQREALEGYAALVREVMATDAFADAGIEPLSVERAYMLVSGLHLTVVRAVERGDDLLALAPELKAVFRAAAGEAATVA